jgi:5-methylthioadenosine/S-adenosylhomocysteine deaminase
MKAVADTIISASWVIPIQPQRVVLKDHAIAIAEGEIREVGPCAQIASKYNARASISLTDHVLIPGLVNLHTHAAMSMMRGCADDKALMDWLRNHIWPIESQFVSSAFVRDGTLLACAEMLRGGITCFADMYFYPEAAAQAAVEAGIRTAVGMIVMDMPSSYASDAHDYLAKGLAMRDALRDEKRLSFCLAPHAPYTTSDSTLERVATYAAELDLPVHIHLHETEDEIQQSVAVHGVRPLERLQRTGMLSPGLIAVHAVHLVKDEIAALALHGCSVAHCPSSNLKLASGIAPLASLLDHGVNVGLGSDGAASNNRLDILNEIRTAALLAKAASRDATAVPAHTALHMATLGGAKALGLDARIGSLEPGKRADITAVDLSSIELAPCYDPASQLVYAAGREHVSHVWVDGEFCVRERELMKLDTRELRAKAAHWKDRIKS